MIPAPSQPRPQMSTTLTPSIRGHGSVRVQDCEVTETEGRRSRPALTNGEATCTARVEPNSPFNSRLQLQMRTRPGNGGFWTSETDRKECDGLLLREQRKQLRGD